MRRLVASRAGETGVCRGAGSDAAEHPNRRTGSGLHDLSERAVDRAPCDAEALRDRRRAKLARQSLDLRRVNADGASFVFAGGLRPGDALALPLQHDFPFPRRHACQDGQAARCAYGRAIAIVATCPTVPLLLML